MILRRFMKHITDQNWFAVGLDVIVVIVGIFLGLQVQGWYEDQAVREQEQIYLNQLHAEVISSLTMAEGRYATASRLNTRIFDLANHFTGKAELSTITNEHCRAIARSHILRNIVITLPTITEIFSSGQLVIIEDQQLKTAISNYALDTERNANTLSRGYMGRNRLGTLFPDLIKLAPPDQIGVLGSEFNVLECDFEAMMNNQSFINELISNSASQDTVTRQFPQQIELLTDLHSELDRLLGITHTGEIP